MKVVRKSAQSLTLRDNSQGRQEMNDLVVKIIDSVKEFGDEKLLELGRKFDSPKLGELRVTKAEIEEAVRLLDPGLRKSLELSIANQRKFQQSIIEPKPAVVETMPGVKVWREWRPIERVGLYVPGGLAAYPSTVIMNVVPAQVSGCKNVVITTPVNRSGQVSQSVLAVAGLLGVDEIYKVGGAQAIAALAYGTETIKPVYKIFGPGNQFVTVAKQLVQQDVAIDMPAGPSEILIIADDTANPAWVAADLLSQAEHGKDSISILLTTSQKLATSVQQELSVQLEALPTKEVARVSLEANGQIVLVDSIEAALELANDFAPEHLELCVSEPDNYLSAICNAGAVFVGSFTPEVAGDYASGSNHVLPTAGFAKSYSGLSVEAFGKWVEFQSITKQGFQELGGSVVNIAEAEGLWAHAEAAKRRLISKRNLK